jgi:alpha-1,3-fucosyltransferase
MCGSINFKFQMRKRFYKKYLCLTILTILLVFLTYPHDFNIIYYSIFDYYDEEPYNLNETTSSYNTTCYPFNKNPNQFNIKIDGQNYPKYLPLYQNKTLNFDCLNQNNNKKLILFWNKWFDDPTFGFGTGESISFKKNNCPVTNCEITTDKKRLQESSIVIFHMRDAIYRLPKYRHPNQRWIFLLYESPKHSDNYDKYNGLFNLTATYRSDSDFVSYYFSNSFLEWGENENYSVDRDFHGNKTDFAAVIISNCKDESQRLDYIHELNQFIPVQIYGKCGIPCPVEDCKEYIAGKYKFFLSFENSICKDYITEKLFDILKYDIVPVTYGGGPYDRHVPKSGFIDAFYYQNAEDLGKYLLHLDSNKTAYNSFFKWKKYLKYNPNTARHGHICEMCIKLNLDYYLGIEKKSIKDFNMLWGDEENCYPI